MYFFGKNARDYVSFARTGMILIVVMGLIRFVVGISGAPYERTTNLVSMSILTLLLFVVYGQKAAATGFGTYRHLLPTAFALSVSMYGFIILAILTEGLTGLHGYFHVHTLNALAESGQVPQGMDPTLMNVPTHIAGQLLAMVPVTFLGWGLASLGFLLSPYLAFLRNAFLLLAGLAVVRIVIGAAGVPQAIGTWVSSLTLLVLVLTVCYGYFAPFKGFDRYWQAIPIGLLMAVVVNLIIMSSTVITTSLMIPNYFQPLDQPIGGEVQAHLRGMVIGIVPLSLLAGIGFALGKRRALKAIVP